MPALFAMIESNGINRSTNEGLIDDDGLFFDRRSFFFFAIRYQYLYAQNTMVLDVCDGNPLLPGFYLRFIFSTRVRDKIFNNIVLGLGFKYVRSKDLSFLAIKKSQNHRLSQRHHHHPNPSLPTITCYIQTPQQIHHPRSQLPHPSTQQRPID